MKPNDMSRARTKERQPREWELRPPQTCCNALSSAANTVLAPMSSITTLTAVAAPLDLANVDTDKVIPARYLRKLRSAQTGYDPYLFHDMRFDAEGREQPEFVLNQAPYRNAAILAADLNFGCGSFL